MKRIYDYPPVIPVDHEQIECMSFPEELSYMAENGISSNITNSAVYDENDSLFVDPTADIRSSRTGKYNLLKNAKGEHDALRFAAQSVVDPVVVTPEPTPTE